MNTSNDLIVRIRARGADDPPLALYGARLHGAYLHRANLSDAILYGADLSDADLSDADLRGADLREADLHGANLSDAVLYGANLSDAVLYGANLSDANLHRANLSDAYLRGAYLHRANLSDANLYGADLHGAILYGAVLYGANLDNTNVLNAIGIYQIWAPAMSSRGDLLAGSIAFEDGTLVLRLHAGCFSGTTEELRAKVLATHGDNFQARLYNRAIDAIVGMFEDHTTTGYWDYLANCD